MKAEKEDSTKPGGGQPEMYGGWVITENVKEVMKMFNRPLSDLSKINPNLQNMNYMGRIIPNNTGRIIPNNKGRIVPNNKGK